MSIAPSNVFYFAFYGFVNSIIVISIAAQLLVDFLGLIQLLTNINKAYLGMTFLAFGNSAGDFFTNPQLAKMGYGIMALSGCFAGQVFNSLVGFGLVLVFQTQKYVLNQNISKFLNIYYGVFFSIVTFSAFGSMYL
ncbi:sodium calcium exchanger protein, putative [Ichthyophthirius multifiliis]|uniref:Sodium calcium exchanger protein, putative n=1 Tax=Ichthyophthirius multifiliis TaxID=5932 RepID=G0QT06_ICHMU|nr:sodium calcium exchanger protein, putative [Ichthyophthirius multifiliis]EGR31643.1 sodium calcium exchanger protein, putative [Ichthyophthirius multifiliis]|eukprot:XP_004035129.1 sodium calcium exchanger protein, putative [Ichthyophthirius multifiliis]